MNAFFASPVRRRRFFAFGNLVPALVLGGGGVMLPVRWWLMDGLVAAAVVGLLVTTGVALFDERRADRALRWAAAGLLAVGLVIVAAFGLSAAYLSGVHGPFGAFGVALMTLVMLLLLPYAVIYPALQLLLFPAEKVATRMVTTEVVAEAEANAEPSKPSKPSEAAS